MHLMSLLFALFVLTITSSHSFSQEYKPINTTIDVVGVKLGMSPSDFRSKFTKDTGFEVTDMFIGSTPFRYPWTATRPDPKDPDYNMLFTIVAKKTTDDAGEFVIGYFFPALKQGENKESLVAVVRNKFYFKNFPSVDSLTEAMSQKLGIKPTAIAKNDYPYSLHYGWRANAAGPIATKPETDIDMFSSSFVKPWKLTGSDGNTHNGLLSDAGTFKGWDSVGFDRLLPEKLLANKQARVQLSIAVNNSHPSIALGFSQALLDPEGLITAYNLATDQIERIHRENIAKKDSNLTSQSKRSESF